MPPRPGEDEADADAPAGAGVESVAAALSRGTRYLARRGVESASRNARFLLAHALSSDLAGLLKRSSDPLDGEAARRFGKLLCSRGGRRPLQHLLGTWEFYGIEIEVGPQALIPRPETECLVERVLAEIGPDDRRVVDVGTGTGCIAIALAKARPGLELIAIDTSPEALELAARNVKRHGLGSRVRLVEGSFLAPLAGLGEPGTIDAVVSNSPYIAEAELAGLPPEVRDHEPRAALVAGPTGLEAFARIVADAGRWLRPCGLMALEVGDGQGEAVCGIAIRAGYGEVALWPDLAGTARVLTARRGAGGMP